MEQETFTFVGSGKATATHIGEGGINTWSIDFSDGTNAKNEVALRLPENFNGADVRVSVSFQALSAILGTITAGVRCNKGETSRAVLFQNSPARLVEATSIERKTCGKEIEVFFRKGSCRKVLLTGLKIEAGAVDSTAKK